MKSGFALMKTVPLLAPNEAKSPRFSRAPIFISSLAERLHFFISPQGDFISTK